MCGVLRQHVDQIIAALEVPASRLIPDGHLDETSEDYWRRMGLTERSAVMRSRKAMRERYGSSLG